MANTRMIETLANTSEGLEGRRKQSGQLSEDVDQLGSEAAPTVRDGVCVTVCLEMGGWCRNCVYLCLCVCVCSGILWLTAPACINKGKLMQCLFT